MKENDTFKLSKAVNATVIGEHTEVVLSVGTIVTVVLVFGEPPSRILLLRLTRPEHR